ncbi:hypothetical protein F511_26015 [Dorcoceras hygrometricum]|uniref:Uncharacterized protein n=1 Tax=Dorcoceras hygrometricum TaxID=472368 RepID=A0A2Z7D5T2_9LAMI|nr:hypothetical protein F511_26015 [Dorcoceras hygrometricum]
MRVLKSSNLPKCWNQQLERYQTLRGRRLFEYQPLSQLLVTSDLDVCISSRSRNHLEQQRFVGFQTLVFSCDGQSRALRDPEATTFCEQEPSVGFASVFHSGYRNYVVLD